MKLMFSYTIIYHLQKGNETWNSSREFAVTLFAPKLYIWNIKQIPK